MNAQACCKSCRQVDHDAAHFIIVFACNLLHEEESIHGFYDLLQPLIFLKYEESQENAMP